MCLIRSLFFPLFHSTLHFSFILLTRHLALYSLSSSSEFSFSHMSVILFLFCVCSKNPLFVLVSEESTCSCSRCASCSYVADEVQNIRYTWDKAGGGKNCVSAPQPTTFYECVPQNW